jgi:hypothetical protein
MTLATGGKRLAALLIAVILTACAGAPKDPVARLIQDVSKAVEERDVTAVASRLAEDFQGQAGLGRADTLATVRRFLAGYDSVGVQVFDERRADESHVAFRVNFTGKPKNIGGLAGLLPGSAVYEFELELAGTGADLKVRRASWRPWYPPASP